MDTFNSSFKTKILYINGFNENSKGNTLKNLCKFYANYKNPSSYCVISENFPHFYTDVVETQQQIEKIIESNKVQILVGESLGGFYALCCKKCVKKIVINPCMMPSKEIPLLLGKSTKISENVISKWKELEHFNFPKVLKNAFGIFGESDKTFHYGKYHNFSILFEKRFPSYFINQNHPTANLIKVTGKHSLSFNSIKIGIKKAMQYFEKQDAYKAYKAYKSPSHTFYIFAKDDEVGEEIKIKVNYISKDFWAYYNSEFGTLSFGRHLMYMAPLVYTESYIRKRYEKEICEGFLKTLKFLRSHPGFIENTKYKFKKELELILKPIKQKVKNFQELKKSQKALLKKGELEISEYLKTCKIYKNEKFELYRAESDFISNFRKKENIPDFI